MVSNKTLSLFGILALVSTVIIVLFWDQPPFSSLKVDVSMDRSAAIATAVEQSKSFSLISEHTKHAVMYAFDDTLRNYVELKAGGRDVFQSIIDEKITSPYYWSVRIFKEQTIAEARFYYRPNGDPYGFNHKIPEDHADASLSKEDAVRLVNERVNDYWKGDFSDYTLIESSLETQSNSRMDHSFVYEHAKKDMGEARVRLKVQVTGTQVSKVEPFTYVPEAFVREFANMRSSNTTISLVSEFLIFGLYFLLIGVPALVILKRKGWLKYSKTSMVVAGIIALLIIMSSINFLPIQLFWYDTANSLSQYILQLSFGWVLGGLFIFIISAISFVLAESLTRKAFPNHIRLWKTWSRDVASSKPVLNNTLFSYLMVPCDLAIVLLFYAITHKYFGFWTPSEALVDRNYLATFCPWFSGFAISLQAGFGEEMLFRALPLSVGLLLGRRFNRPILGLSIAMVVQAVIFGAAHANYPTMPAYARVVELIVPSLIFGFIYLRLGVVFGVIMHYLYDVVLFSMPILASSGYLLDKSMVVLVAMIPLGVVLVQRYRTKQWNTLKDTAFNRSFEPEVVDASKAESVESDREIIAETETDSELASQSHRSYGNKKIWAFGLLVCLVVLWVFQDNRIDIPMDSIELSRAEAITLGEKYLAENNLQLAEGYQGYATYNAHNHSDAFVWQELGESVYKNWLGSYLKTPGWSIRFVNYEGTVESKNEEINLRMDLEGRVNYFDHTIPEERAGASLSKEAAKVIADRAIQERFGLNIASLKMVSEISEQQPNRMDWTFVYEAPNDTGYEGMQLRSEIKIAGDQLVYSNQYVFKPETWDRMNRERNGVPNLLNGIIQLIGQLFIIIIFLKYAFQLLTTEGFSYRTFALFAILSLLVIINYLNNASLFAYFPTDQPIENLKLGMIGFIVLNTALVILFIGLAFATLRSILKPTNQKISVADAVFGGLFAAALFYVMTLPLEMLFQDTRVTYPQVFLGGFYIPWISTLNIYHDILYRIAVDLLIAKLLFSFTKGYQNTVKANVIGFLLIALFIGFLHFPISFLMGVSFLKVALISLGTFLIFKYVIRNRYWMVPIFSLGLYAINKGLARGGFFGFESYPYESIVSLASPLIAGIVILYCMRLVINPSTINKS